MGSIAQWCDNYARKIGGLPLLNVDPELTEYGLQVAQTLSQVSLTIRGGAVQGGIEARSSQKVYNTYSHTNTYGYTYRYGAYGYGGGVQPIQDTQNASVIDARATEANRANIRANYRGQSSLEARKIFSSIDSATAEIRVKMVQKYQVEF